MIDVIGLGVTDRALLSSAAQAALENSALVIGSARQLAVVGHILTKQQQVNLPPLAELSQLLEENKSLATVILASGDPLHYGIGRWLMNKLAAEVLNFHPAVSSMQAACHLLGVSLQDVEVLSLHGRPVEKIRSALKVKSPLLVLTDKNSQPQRLAQECLAAGFAQTTITVVEKIGYPQQTVRQFSLDELLNGAELSFDALHVSYIEPQGLGGILPEFPGFEDQLFSTGMEQGKGMITKREVRLAILSMLQPSHSDVIWDIGAGCGSVTIELAYWQKNAKVYALEHHPQRLSCLHENREKFGVSENVSIIAGRAPQQLSILPAANKVFIGGSDGELLSILISSWQQLPENGLLVASAVTENTKFQLQQFAEQLSEHQQVETLQIAVSKGTRLAGQLLYKPNLSVTLYKFTKHDVK
ncbi:MAG: precorrin-6y C5,15-methyltransferase (decarboxylating) subunit CbiE [Colwellia sp.]|nr:precorrin-6y C5,15-methyltransferase (decarboxylating) subunit CbiE [Colwellia sp.]